MGYGYGLPVVRAGAAAVCPDSRTGLCIRKAEDTLMDIFYLISLILTVLLAIYLIAALFFPERFT